MCPSVKKIAHKYFVGAVRTESEVRSDLYNACLALIWALSGAAPTPRGRTLALKKTSEVSGPRGETLQAMDAQWILAIAVLLVLATVLFFREWLAFNWRLIFFYLTTSVLCLLGIPYFLLRPCNPINCT